MKKKSSFFRAFTSLILFVVFFSFTTTAQIKINSPYSRYGLGDMHSLSSVSSFAMGGANYAFFDSTRINSVNPAALMAMDSSFFLFDFGLNGAFTKTFSSSNSSQSNYFNLAHFKMAFPVTPWYRSGFGLTPFSSIGYDVTTSEKIDSIGNVDFEYIGEGGISQFFWGNAFKLNKKLSVGFNLSYLFGTLNTIRTSNLSDISNSFKYRTTNSLAIRNIYYDFGIQYRINLPKGYFLNFGGVFTPQQSLSATKITFGETYTTNSSDYETIKDTINYGKGNKGKIVMPMKMGGGLYFGKKNIWGIAADVSWQNWENYSFFGSTSSLQNALTYNVGINYKVKKVNYRAGFHYTEGYLLVRNQPISDFGISFGTSFPIRQTNKAFSNIDLGIEYGRKGTTANQLVQQEYLKFYMSLSIKNEWFRKIKFQ